MRAVVPRVGAWIETPRMITPLMMSIRSYPVWVRGLKLPMMSIDLSAPEVVPRVGAWIETNGCTYCYLRKGSYPVWVRGLKPRQTLP